jgi:hypothetical protein
MIDKEQGHGEKGGTRTNMRIDLYDMDLNVAVGLVKQPDGPTTYIRALEELYVVRN